MPNGLLRASSGMVGIDEETRQGNEPALKRRAGIRLWRMARY
ncbi:hypothetical protein BSU04_28355 [Caballeronia sordidicola]|uniref:Uncharacterized protein n=1 Tax=Caballeronia sordidicola TaxID=196367 RepID=A0A226WWV8_CABSO|nr:hypothetical protein BSU04_28355 [Caballeronia sordidicola]